MLAGVFTSVASVATKPEEVDASVPALVGHGGSDSSCCRCSNKQRQTKAIDDNNVCMQATQTFIHIMRMMDDTVKKSGEKDVTYDEQVGLPTHICQSAEKGENKSTLQCLTTSFIV
jgi:hypothetical protein